MRPLKLLTPVIFFALFLNCAFSQSGWKNINDYRAYYYLDGQYISNSIVYLCGGFNGIAKSSDGGMNWTWKTNIQDYYNGFSNMQFFDEQKGIISGEYIGVYKTLNGGDTWQKIYSTDNEAYVGSVSFVNENTGYIQVKISSKILRTTNGGASWVEVYDSPKSVSNIIFINELTGFTNEYAGMNVPNVIRRTTTGGITWDSVSTVPYQVKQFEKLNGNTVLALTHDGKLLKTTDLANSWQTLLDVNTTAGNLSVINQNSFVVTHYSEKAMLTTDGGQTWTTKNTPMNSIAFANNAGDLILAGDNYINKLYKISSNWNQMTDVFENKITQNLINIKIFDENNFYSFADSNYIIKSTNGGVTLSREPWNASGTSVYFKDMNIGYAMVGNKFCKTQNTGASWDTVSSFAGLFQGQFFSTADLYFVNDNFGYITVRNGGINYSDVRIYFTTNGGYNWSQSGVASYSSGSGTYSNYEYISNFKMTSPSTGYHIFYKTSYTQGGQGPESYDLRKTSNGGSNWVSLNGNINARKIYQVNFINDNTGYITADSSRFFKTTNGGETWTLKSLLSFTPGSLYMIDELNGYLINVPDFYRTTDGGTTWSLQNPGVNIGAGYNKISFLNSQFGFILGRDGMILETRTGGTVSIGNNNSLTPDKYYLSQNYPNPFNPETKIQFSIPKNTIVKIAVYDLLGREVKELVNEFKQQGSYNVSFNGANLSSGIYFYKLITDDFIETKKMILVK